MDKVLPILEKYVEWIALGIGALFLGLMAYSYAVQTPATVELNGKELAPSAVDPAIKESPDMSGLVGDIGSKNGPPMPTVPPVASALQNTYFTPISIPDIKVGVAQRDPGEKPPVSAEVALAVPPKATPFDFSTGWGLYQWAKWAPPPAGAPAVPGQPPAEGAAFNPGAGMPAQMVQQEFGWWTGRFDVSMAQLVNAFKAAKLNPANPEIFKTAFLGVELYRQEKQLDGAWGKEMKVAALPEYEPQLKPLPTESLTRNEKAAYMVWASQNVVMLMQPVFPQVVAGDPWYAPGTPPPAKVNQIDMGQPPVPGAPVVPGGGGFGPGERPIPSRPTPNSGGVSAPQRGTPYPFMLAMSGPAVGSEGYPPRGQFVPPGGAPGFTPDGGFGAGATPGVDPGSLPGVSDPEGVFYPDLQLQQAVAGGLQDVSAVILAHDITVQPGKTYRYRVRYFIRNPLFLVEEGVKPELSNKLVLSSDFSDWSKDFTVAPRIEFWVNKINETRGVPDDAEFEVFVAGAAGWKPEKVKAGPGDQIAKGEGNSGWSVVDIRKGRDNKYEIVLVDTNGILQRRDLQTDLDDPKRRERSGVPLAPPPGLGEGVAPGGPSESGGVPGRRPTPAPGFTRDP